MGKKTYNSEKTITGLGLLRKLSLIVHNHYHITLAGIAIHYDDVTPTYQLLLETNKKINNATLLQIWAYVEGAIAYHNSN